MSRFTPEKASPLIRPPLIRPPLTRSKERQRSKAPLTPLQHLKKKFESHLLEKKVKVEEEISPVLYDLRNTPVKTLKEKQNILLRKHDDSRNRTDQLNIGGGVSLWPEMENMRLRQREIIQLVFSCICLVVTLMFIFQKFHGSSLILLNHFTEELKKFSPHHPIIIRNSNFSFKTSLLSWHSDYRKLIKKMENEFDMKLLSVPYQLFLFFYVAAILFLVYFLIDNVFSKNKLSPRRIKNWVRLLVLVTTWTLLLSHWLAWAYRLEQTVKQNILQLADILGDVLERDLELDLYNMILLYWRTRFLPPTGQGVIYIIGMFPVRDVVYYLQYYSLPILTVILTPVVKLVIALSDIYSWKKFQL